MYTFLCYFDYALLLLFLVFPPSLLQQFPIHNKDFFVSDKLNTMQFIFTFFLPLKCSKKCFLTNHLLHISCMGFNFK